MSKMNVNKALIQSKNTAKNLLPTSGAGCQRDMAYDITVKPPIATTWYPVCVLCDWDVRFVLFVYRDSGKREISSSGFI